MTHRQTKEVNEMTVKIETRYGMMEFATWPEAYEFRDVIATWTGFTEETKPVRVEAAVEYHLAYREGGFAEVRHVMRECERKIAEARREELEFEAHGGMPRELWGAPPEVIAREWKRRMEAGWLGW
jgi:hypothetical protein